MGLADWNTCRTMLRDTAGLTRRLASLTSDALRRLPRRRIARAATFVRMAGEHTFEVRGLGFRGLIGAVPLRFLSNGM